MNVIATGAQIRATDVDGRIIRGTIVGRSFGADGAVYAYDVKNPVTGNVAQAYPASYSIEVR